MPTFDSDRPLAVYGVPGRLTHRTTKPDGAPGLWFSQRWISESRPIAGWGEGVRIRAELRFDDECGNGHNSFAITGEIYKPVHGYGRGGKGIRNQEIACGCIHEDIARAFPELAPLIKWHLFDSTGPMHYIANVIYLAGDRDCWGKRAGEPRQFGRAVEFGGNPIRHKLSDSFAKFLEEAAKGGIEGPFDLEVIQVPHKNQSRAGEYQFSPKYTFGGYGSEWHECPFDSEDEALRFLSALQRCAPRFVQVPTSYGEGKARDLDGARRAAVWPDAPDAVLTAEPAELRAALEARLPALVAEFRAAIEGAGLLWAPSDAKVPA